MASEGLVDVTVQLGALLVREFIAAMGYHVAPAALGTLVRMLPLMVLPFAAARSLWRGAFWLALALICMELFFVYNRLTGFANKPLTVAELIGNGGELLLGLILLTRRRPWGERQNRRLSERAGRLWRRTRGKAPGGD